MRCIHVFPMARETAVPYVSLTTGRIERAVRRASWPPSIPARRRRYASQLPSAGQADLSVRAISLQSCQRPPFKTTNVPHYGNRQKQYADARSLLARFAVEEVGHPAAEVARSLGITRMGVHKAAMRGSKLRQNHPALGR